MSHNHLIQRKGTWKTDYNKRCSKKIKNVAKTPEASLKYKRKIHKSR